MTGVGEDIAKSLFRFRAARSRDPAVDAWFDAQSPELADIARFWFECLRECGDDVRELIHDGCPVACVNDAAFAYVNAFKSHVNVGFYFGAHLDDPASLLDGTGKRMRHVRLQPDRTTDAPALQQLIEDAHADMQRKLALLGA